MAEQIRYDLSDLGTPLFSSRSSQVFQLRDPDKLLKLFRPEVDQHLIDNEEINTTETFEKGISAVECYGQARVDCPDGLVRSGLIIKKDTRPDPDRQGHEKTSDGFFCLRYHG